MINFLKKNFFLYYYARVFAAFFRLFDSNFKTIKAIKDTKRLINKFNKKKILLAGSIPINPDSLIQSVVGTALNQSAEVDFISCDGVLPICFNAKKVHYPTKKSLVSLCKNGQGLICSICKMRGVKYEKSSNFNRLNFSDYQYQDKESDDLLRLLNRDDPLKLLKNIKHIKYKGINLGQHVYSATVRFFASSALHNEECIKEILLRYIEAGLKTINVFFDVFAKNTYDAVICDHGIYIPQGIITDICKAKDIKIFTFNTGYRKKTFLFAEGDSYHFAIPRDKQFNKKKYSDNQRFKALEYVKSREKGINDWVFFQEKSSDFSLNFSKKNNNIALFPNVLWDADIHFEEGLFDNSIDWIVQSIRYLIKNTNKNIYLRVHPGEIKGFISSRVRCDDLIPDDIKNNERVIIFPAEHTINSYFLARKCEINVVYGSKIGIDLAALGHCVVVAGDCWTRGKDVTIDPKSRSEYFNYLSSNNLPTKSLTRALDFAYYLYFEKLVKFDFVEKRKGDPPFELRKDLFLSDIDDKDSDFNSLLKSILS